MLWLAMSSGDASLGISSPEVMLQWYGVPSSMPVMFVSHWFAFNSWTLCRNATEFCPARAKVNE